MPSTFKGFGTSYLGPVNKRQEEGTCEFCGYHGSLSSYDTGYFIVALCLPLFSLGQQHISRECPKCKKHHRIPRDKFQKEKQKGVTAVRTELSREKPDFTVLKELLGCFYTYQDPNPLQQIAYDVIEVCKDDASMLILLSKLFSHYHFNDQALACGHMAHKIQESLEVKELIGEMLLYAKKPAEAETYLSHLWERPRAGNYKLATLLVEGYCAIKEFDHAFRIWETIQTTYHIKVARDGSKDLKEFIEKAGKSGKVPFSSTIAMKEKRYLYYKKNDICPYLVGPIPIPLILCAYFITSLILGNFRTVFLVNGTTYEYNVKIGKKEYELLPFSYQKVRISEDSDEVTSTGLDEKRNRQQLPIKTNFFLRPILVLGKTFVINPDQCAILYETDCEYGDNASCDEVYRYKSNGLLHSFSGIDYPFEDFPESLYVDCGEVEKKTALWMIDDYYDESPINTAFIVLSYDSTEKFVANYATLHPDDENAIQTFGNIQPDSAFPFLKKQLDKRPVNIALHRIYQNVAKTHFPEIDLAREYTEYLKEDSLNSELLYLTGRAVADSLSLPYFHKSIEVDAPSPYGFNALAYEYFNRGYFGKASYYSGRAVRLNEDVEYFRDNYFESLHAYGMLDKLLYEIEKRIIDEPLNFSNQLYKFELLLKLDRMSDAAQCINSYISLLEEDGEEEVGEYKKTFQLCRSIFMGNKSRLLQHYEKDSDYKLYEGFLKADTSLYDPILSEEGIDEGLLLLGYVVAEEQNRSLLANRYYKRALSELKRYGSLYSDIVFLLEEGATQSSVDKFSVPFEDKALYYAVLGTKYPELRSHCFEKAKWYNYKVNPRKSILDIIL